MRDHVGLLSAIYTTLLLFTSQSSATTQGSLASSPSVQFPECALACLTKAIPASGCAATNQTCLCSSAAFSQQMTTCVELSCTVKEGLRTLNASETSCGRPVRDKSTQYSTISNAFVTLSTAFILQRFGYKIYAGTELALDDWFTLATLVFGIPASIINGHFLPANGIGRDVWTLTPEQITNFGRLFYVQEIIYFTEVWLAKLAFLFFYMRIFPSSNVRRVLWGTVIFNLLFGISFSSVAIFQCQPISYFWNMWDTEHKGRCLNINAISWSNAIISIILDVWMLCIPLWQLRKLKLGWKKKLSVALMFSVGAFVTIVSILRLKSLLTFRYTTRNPTWDFFEVGIWSDVEINVSMICICLPTLRLFLVQIFPKLRETTSNRSRSYMRTPGESGPHGPERVGRGRVQNDTNATGEQNIWYQKAFTVKYSENDEINLVSVRSQER